MGGNIKIEHKPFVPVTETPEITALIGIAKE
jgi:hypothetical protein